MNIRVQISVYPLRQEHLSPTVNAVEAELNAHGLRPEVGGMSTQVVGETEVVFAALRDAFMRVANSGQVVMTVTVSNACPV
ncbi:MAG: YkoF family thiamine/hydroxymethylpyrimidine-binding protein [Candidatus Binataceae bacterium]